MNCPGKPKTELQYEQDGTPEKDNDPQTLARIKLRQREVEQLAKGFIEGINPNKAEVLEKVQKEADVNEEILTYLAEMTEDEMKEGDGGE